MLLMSQQNCDLLTECACPEPVDGHSVCEGTVMKLWMHLEHLFSVFLCYADTCIVCVYRWLHARPVSSNVLTAQQTHRRVSASSNSSFSVNRQSANPAWYCVLSKDNSTNIKKVLLAVCTLKTLLTDHWIDILQAEQGHMQCTVHISLVAGSFTCR